VGVDSALDTLASVLGEVGVDSVLSTFDSVLVEVAGGGDAGRVETGVAAAAPEVGLGVAGAPGPAQAATNKLIAATVVVSNFAVGFT
jgi:hypothetical protein